MSAHAWLELLRRLAAAPAEEPHPLLLSRERFWAFVGATYATVEVDAEFAYADLDGIRVRTTLSPLEAAAFQEAS